MKKIFTIILCFGMIIAFSSGALTEECTTIQSDNLTASDGTAITPGYDK